MSEVILPAHPWLFRKFVLDKSEGKHRGHLGQLYDLWERWNREHFSGELQIPYITLTEPSASRILGQCCPTSRRGGSLEIKIRPSLLTGTHPKFRRKPYAGAITEQGRFLYAADVLLHEMVHQYQHEVLNVTEAAYHGHGPAFRDKCNEIGVRLGLGPVRTSKRRGRRDADLPSCSDWPHNVREDGYYLGTG